MQDWRSEVSSGVGARFPQGRQSFQLVKAAQLVGQQLAEGTATTARVPLLPWLLRWPWPVTATSTGAFSE